MERLINANHRYAAGFLSYEAAPAFDLALQTQETHASIAEQSAQDSEVPISGLASSRNRALFQCPILNNGQKS
jgi:hypothetical protein